MSHRAHLSTEHRELLERTERLAADTLAPIAAAGRPGAVNRALLTALGEHGVLSEVYPVGDGGYAPAPAMRLCLVREGLARHCTQAETALALQALGGYPLLRAGRPELAAAWIPRIAAGQAVAAFALTEPDAGSDAGAVALKVTRDGDGYRLSGEKTFISNAPEADIYSVFARTTEGAGTRGMTAFAVPGDSPGLSGEPIDLIDGHPIGTLRFDDVFVPDSHQLGELDQGWQVAMSILDLSRPSVGAYAVGMGQAALDAAVAHTASRNAFGRALREFQGVSHQLAEVATRLHAARVLVHNAAAAYDASTGSSSLSAMAKLFATEAAQFAVDVAIQVHGARALARDHPLAHLYHGVRAPRIYEGASEIQREIIARALYRDARP